MDLFVPLYIYGMKKADTILPNRTTNEKKYPPIHGFICSYVYLWFEVIYIFKFLCVFEFFLTQNYSDFMTLF